MSKQNASSGVSLGTVVQVVFIILKLTDNVDWPWLWVLSPLWIGTSVAIVVFGLVWIVSEIGDARVRKRRRKQSGW